MSADPHCYALLIGQGYPDFPERKRLTAPAYDVGGMAAMLGIMSATPYQVTVKYDLTADGILSAIRNTFAEARPGDICLFYYSGHGEYKASDPSLTGALVGVDANFVTLSALRNALNGVNGDKIVVLDSCYSGVMVVNRGEAADGQDDALLDEVNRAVIRTFAMASRGDADGKYYVMTSARYDELAYDYAGQSDPHRYGIFTAFLLEGSGYSERTDAFLGNLAADTDGNRMITLREGFTFASAEATDFYLSLGKTDHPHAQVYPENSSFVLWGQGK